MQTGHKESRGVLPFSLVVLIVFSFSTSVHADYKGYTAEMDDYIKHLPPAAHTSAYEKELRDLTSDDPNVAIPIVKKLGDAKDNRSLEMALLHPSVKVQIEAAKQLQKVGTQSDAPLLLAAIQEIKYVPADTDTKELKTDLLVALARIEGLNLQDGAIIDDAMEARIIAGAQKPQ